MNKYAIVKTPAKTFAKGITNSKLGAPDYTKVINQHQKYCEALKQCELNVKILEADDRFPDSCFVEDTAIITKDLAIITKPSSPSRLGETQEISEYLSNIMRTTQLTEGRLDGGDIMKVGNHYYIGISERTNLAGANSLATILEKEGYTSSAIPVERILHLKTGITYLNKSIFVSIKDFDNKIINGKFILTDKSEEYAANCLFINNNIIMPSGFPNLKLKIEKLNCKIIEVDMSEFQKMDGGLTCLSLIY